MNKKPSFKRIDHIGIAVRSIDATLPFYTEILGLMLTGIETVESEGVRVAFLKIGDVQLELLEPLSLQSTISHYIDKYGEGIHHIALETSEIEQQMKHIVEHGGELIYDQPRTGANQTRMTFIHPRSAHSVLYELLEKKTI
ncbi:MAG TPA: methylmalonyl-CoA epimerase [Cerasibacillus sp.]|uniref:methylmalonyl-CoA epimerase n=1 Tax=Cerasibacillus sp. TaxID=2498711 RepID=UPI002F3F2CB8